MIDLAKKRAENLARLTGAKVEEGSSVKKITLQELVDEPENAWHVISLATKKEMVDGKTTSTGKIRRVQGKNLAYPDLLESINVGGVERRGKNKGTFKMRTNLDTMRYMYSVHNKMRDFYLGESNDEIAEYFSTMIEVLDSYATTVVTLAIDSDPDLLDKVYEIDLAEEKAMKENLSKARDNKDKDPE